MKTNILCSLLFPKKISDKSYYEKFADGTVKCIDEEIPFEVPEGWEWVRLKSLLLKLTDGTHHSPINNPIGDYKYITAKNIKLNGISLKDITFVSSEVHTEIYSRCNPEFGDILYIKDGATTGIATINTLDEPFSMLSSVALLKPSSYISNQYLLRYLQSPFCYDFTRSKMKGVGITRVTLNQMQNWLIPIPNIKTQNRIVNKIDELLLFVEDIESNKTDLQQYTKHVKSKVLDLAIRGKLVPQDPNDEPASVLLECIKSEHPESKKKASKTSDNSHYRNLPFEIPKSWEWVRLGDISTVLYGVSESAQTEGNYKLLRITDIQNNSVNWESVPFTHFLKIEP